MSADSAIHGDGTFRIGINRARPLREGGTNGHNRWHPDLPPVASVESGATVTFEIRDARDRAIGRRSTHADLLRVPASMSHPLTGPVEIQGAEPGDVLEVEVIGYETDDFGWTAIWPGCGILGDQFKEPFLARWELDGAHARSEDIPGVAVPACIHAGVIGVAPSRELVQRAQKRESTLDKGGVNLGAPGADPACPPEVVHGLRTVPPRETGGNIDIRDLGSGARLWLPVHVPGALLSVGDLHFAQGDGELCETAIETGGVATVRVAVRRGGWRPAFPCYEAPPRPSRRMFATTGIPISDSGAQCDRDLGVAARQAASQLLEWLMAERGLGREAAYVLMSVAAELRISELVNGPNVLVSAALPLDLFEL